MVPIVPKVTAVPPNKIPADSTIEDPTLSGIFLSFSPIYSPSLPGFIKIPISDKNFLTNYKTIFLLLSISTNMYMPLELLKPKRRHNIKNIIGVLIRLTLSLSIYLVKDNKHESSNKFHYMLNSYKFHFLSKMMLLIVEN